MSSNSSIFNYSDVANRFLSYQSQFENSLKSIKDPKFLEQFHRATELLIQTIRSKKAIAVAL